MIIVQTYTTENIFKHLGQYFNSIRTWVNLDLTLVWTLVNSDLKSFRTLANSDPIFKKALVNSDLVFMGSELTSGRGPNSPRSELTKVRISHSWGPN